MTAGTLIALVLAVIAAAFVVAPLFRGDARQAEERSGRLGEARELASRQAMLVATLRDLEDDRATDKIDEADYRELHDRLSAEAVEVLRRLDEVDLQDREEQDAESRAARPLPHPGSRRPGPLR